MIRSELTFRHAAPFVECKDAEGIMSIDGAGWFVALLRKVPRLVVDSDLCQEDWGVVVFASRDGFKFWFGLSSLDEGEWIAHVHHWGLLQRFRAIGKSAFAVVISDLHAALAADDSITDVLWYYEDGFSSRDARGAASPDAT